VWGCSNPLLSRKTHTKGEARCGCVWAEQCDAKCGEMDSIQLFDSVFLFPIRRFSSAYSRILESIIGVVSVVGQRGWKIVRRLAKR